MNNRKSLPGYLVLSIISLIISLSALFYQIGIFDFNRLNPLAIKDKIDENLPVKKYIVSSEKMIFMTEGEIKTVDIILVNGTTEENRTGFSFGINDSGQKDVIVIESSTTPEKLTIRALKSGFTSLTVKNKFADNFNEVRIFVYVKTASSLSSELS
ncbi:hypothetical protein [Treponema sp. UBA753]|uniref:hypothetical protein n=1 Tax=Treponema sp. UBA753 TaxID=1947747 RepID=UPI0025E9FEC7|nr:hypothetical protein [Treponema sp. UBA753]